MKLKSFLSENFKIEVMFLSVEDMKMISVIGQIDDINLVADEMVKCGCVHVVNSIVDINNHSDIGNSPVPNLIRPYKVENEYLKIKENMEKIMEVLGIDKRVKTEYIDENIELMDISNSITLIYNEALKYKNMLDKSERELNRIMELYENVINIKELRFAPSELRNLKFFDFKIGKIRKNYYIKLKENIENIPSIIYRIGSKMDYVVIIAFTPKPFVPEVEDIFKSLGFEEIYINRGAGGVPGDVIKKLEERIEERNKKIETIKGEILNLRKKHEPLIERYYSIIKKYEKIQQINNEAACTDYVFYLCGWIPESARANLSKGLEKVQDRLVLTYREQNEVRNGIPPTSLKNNRLVKPFEFLVKMYGIPGYGEVDPTSFVAISYMVMFGVMFGDVGQGFVLLCGGLYLSLAKKQYDFGGILSRVGLSSMIFGLLYGSIFGNEEIIRPLLIHPLENINIMLLGGVILGVVLSTISYIYNFINSGKSRDIEEGIFGREGLAGFIFYWTCLLCALSIYRYGRLSVPIPIVQGILVLLLAAMIIKQPLARFIEGKRPLYNNSPGDYYIESVFGVIETLLGMLSKTISFVRLGAFALNHVGLFIAFATVSEMVNNRAGSIAVNILGNIIIIGLEGLVVFIQGLRLEYYELFSRFYRGDGIEYKPVCLPYDE